MSERDFWAFVQRVEIKAGLRHENGEWAIPAAPDPDPVQALTAELEAPHEPPTACKPEELPDQVGPRYPLVPVPRDALSLWALFMFWLRLRAWRRAYARWEQPRSFSDLGPQGK